MTITYPKLQKIVENWWLYYFFYNFATKIATKNGVVKPLIMIRKE